jgi:hypothetical protein
VTVYPFKVTHDDIRYLIVYALFQGDGDNNGEEVEKDLRSRGLCLIPVGCTLHVASTNGADYWSPATIGNNVSPSTITKQ